MADTPSQPPGWPDNEEPDAASPPPVPPAFEPPPLPPQPGLPASPPYQPPPAQPGPPQWQAPPPAQPGPPPSPGYQPPPQPVASPYQPPVPGAPPHAVAPPNQYGGPGQPPATTRLGTTSRTGQEVTPQSVDHPWGDLWGACPCHWFMHRVFRDRNQSTRRRVEPIPVSHRRWRLRESNLVVRPWMQLGYVGGRSGERVPGCRHHLQPEQLIGHQQFGHRLWQLLSRRPKRQFHRPTTSQHRRLEDLRVQRQLDRQQDQSAGTMYSVMLVVEP